MTQTEPHSSAGRAEPTTARYTKAPIERSRHPRNARDVKNFLSEAMAEIRAGKMDPKLGTTLGYLGTSLLKAIETSDIEERLEVSNR